MRFQHRLELTADPGAVWQLVAEVERVAACIPNLGGVEVVEPGRRYRGTVADRVGPFRVRFPLDLEVSASRPVLEVKAAGRDAALGSHAHLRLVAAVAPAPAGPGSRLDLDVDLQVTGRLATLGQGMMARKFAQQMADFAAALQRRLEGGGSHAASL